MLYCPEEDCRKRAESGRNSLGRAAPAGEVTVCKPVSGPAVRLSADFFILFPKCTIFAAKQK